MAEIDNWSSHLIEKQDLTPIPAFNPSAYTGAGNNTFLLDGAEPTLIDAGTGIPAHVDAVAAALSGRPLVRVLVTHGHVDHAAGAPALRARWPEVELRKWPLSSDESDAPWLPLAEGDHVCAGDRRLLVLHTPGHAPDHVCFWDADRGDLYAGDMLIAGTTVVIPASRGGSLRAYLRSLDRLAALRPVRVLPGHGPIISDALALIAKYREHRLFREEQVLACLEAGVSSLAAIVARLYPDLDPALAGAARETVLAHVEKLREDGRTS